ncbi:MAG: carbohydrate kinase [Christensenella sp.]|nr:carbohydrate kinase [Christensenella sp.]
MENVHQSQLKYDIATIGECLIDFVPSPSQQKNKINFSGCPGGSVANVLACAAKLGLSTSFITKLSTDVFGTFLSGILKDAGIGMSSVITTDQYPTTLAFVSLDNTGDRTFSFYRNQTADCMITPEELDLDMLCSCSIFHFSTVSMSAEPSRSATVAAVRTAKENGATIAFDPNLRPPLWDNLDNAKAAMEEGLALSRLVKISDYELSFLTGTEDIPEGMKKLLRHFPIELLVVTCGEKGSYCLHGDDLVSHKGYRVATIDTTGAGDAFWGSFLYQLSIEKMDFSSLTPEKLTDMLRFSNATGALTTTKHGAIPSLPTLNEIRQFMEKA